MMSPRGILIASLHHSLKISALMSACEQLCLGAKNEGVCRFDERLFVSLNDSQVGVK